ncbi:MAG: NAD-dependent epimerase/dehydratase family protein [Rhodococcus sp. (in: high G+C Gram-positive bacteria)]|uniref:NAD(P)H-binding protein n=1 Tax=Rhodococcus sp. TaxID=1831 RepID=UPI0012146FCE|nr:NAD(P)H-binding protein [Rhodococcus sp. (in: high G+C Gram-positive bacteria)]RZL24658.1 MAG: NAD-dependent epimerase/dehydratase family protein [Rhodococcus sp. (in: high G+C Gram-positive bacteria)]
MSSIAIFGAHGQVGRLTTRALASAGHTVLAVIRNPNHRNDVEDDGGTAIILDLERATPSEVAEAIRGADSAIFTAGSGAGSGPQRKDSLDRAGALLAMEASALADIVRFVQVSYLGADEPSAPGTSPDMVAYQQAKHAADEALRGSSLRWTIVRPGLLNDNPATGRVAIGEKVHEGTTSRANTAALLALLATTDRAVGHVLNVIDGDTLLEDVTPR